MTFSFFVPLKTAAPNAQEVLNPDTGLPSTATDDAKATARWRPIDTRDPVITVTSDVTPNDSTLTLRSLATQKSVDLVNDTGAPGYTPGDTVEYTLQVQVSDYFAFDNLVLTDILGDGLALDPGFTPTLDVSEHGVNTTTTFTAPNFTLTSGTPDDTLTFRISDQLVTLGQDGVLLGGNIPPGGTGAGNLPQTAPALFSPGTTATIRFRAIIQDTYKQTQPTGNTTVTPNDTIPNDVTVDGTLLDRENLSPLPANPEVTDTSSADVTIVDEGVSKTVYAINGNTAIGDPVTIAPGDTVTYRLQVSLPTTSASNFKLTDFLPLPLFKASELTTLNLTSPSAAPPAAGTATLGPSDTFFARYAAIGGSGPTVSVNTSANSFTLDFGSFNDSNNLPTELDLLFTVTATSDPKADQLLLTNELIAEENNRLNVTQSDTSLVQVITSEPSLPDGSIQKGVVATDNPKAVFTPAVVGPVTFSAPGTPGPRFTGTLTTSSLIATPIDSNLRGVDAGDRVTFAVVVANVGSGPNGAFDVGIRDTLPAGFRIPASGLNMMVTDGTGAIMPFINLGSGTSAGLFGTGIQLTDPGPTASPAGALDPGEDLMGNPINNGRNIVVITYDLQVVGTIAPNRTITNTASLFSFADTEGGPNFLTTPRTDRAQVTTAVPTFTKSLVGTEIVNANNSNDQAVIGELVTYQITITLPEGITSGLTVQDTLDDGLAFVKVNSVTRSAGVVGGVVTPVVSNDGRTGTYDLGTVIDKNRDNSVPDTLTIRYTAVVLNQASNQNGTQLRNNARMTFKGGDPATASAPAITVLEPTINISKQARVGGSGTVGEAGSTVEYTIVLTNPGTVDAFDLTLNDPFPRASNGRSLIADPVLTNVDDTDGRVTTAAFQIVGSATAGYTLRTRPGVTFDFPVESGRSITLRVTGTLTTAVQPAELIHNTATVRWTSLNGHPGTRSKFNANSTERTGRGTGPNDYVASGSADITISGSIVKTLVSTSDSFTQGSDVAIGEVVRYQLLGVFAQGSLPNVVILDDLPAGMQYLDDGTTKIAFVSNGPGFAVDNTLFPVGSAAFATGNQSTSVTPTFVLPASQISVDPGSGDVGFALGDVVNNDNDPDSELVVVQFNALVLNEAANQAGVELSNDFVIHSNGIAVGNPSPPVDVRVVEPHLTINKQVSPTTGDAGDRFNFSVTITNATGAAVSPAHDIRVLDMLSTADYALDLSSVTVTPIGTNTAFTDNSSGNTVDVTVDTLLPGASVIVNYSAILTSEVEPLQTVSNTATVTYTSLPGPTGEANNPTGSITPGGAGDADGERNGEGGVNDYIGSATASVQVPGLALNKVVATTSFSETGLSQHDPTVTDLAIGEEVTYLVRFTLPEVTTPAVLVDDLPIAPGELEAVSSRVVSIGSNISGSLLQAGEAGILSDRNGDGIDDRVSFNFGTLVNSPDNVVDAKDMIFVEVTARVLDVPQNLGGVKLINTATLTYINGMQLTDTAPVEIVEPRLDITKNVVNTSTVNAGGVVDYEAVVRHTDASTMDAMNVEIDDLLPPSSGLTLVPGSVVVTSATGSTVTEPDPASGSGFLVSIPSIPLGDEVVIDYQAIVTPNAKPGDSFPNTVDLVYNGTPGDPTVRPQNDEAGANLVVDGTSLSGFVFHEQRPGPNLPIAGVAVTLTGTDSSGLLVLRKTTTDVNGFYQFSNMVPGTYTIIETQPAGFISSRQEPGTPFGQASPVENQLNVVIPAGSTIPGQNFDFFEAQPSSLSGTVYEDLGDTRSHNLLDPGIPGTLVTLIGVDWNGTAVIKSISTNAFGNYLFGNLLPGDYTIVEKQPSGFLDNADSLGSLSGRSVFNDELTVPNLDQNQAGVNYDFGELLPSSISGFVYVDTNNNGRKNGGEVGISGVRIRLTGTDDLGDPVSAEVRTDSHGFYSFLGLRPGTYSLREIQPPLYLDGKDQAGNLGGTASNDRIDAIVLDPNQAGTDYLFGELLPPPPPLPPVISKRLFLASTH
jgi:large repetitive protein